MNRGLVFNCIVVLVAGLCGAMSASAAEPAIVKATGTLEPKGVVDVNAAVSGIIRAIGEPDSGSSKNSIQFGSNVKKGQVLAQIDPTIYQAMLSQARADLAHAEAGLVLAESKASLAERELQRAAARKDNQSDRARDVEVAKATLDVAKAAVQDQMAALEQCKAKVQRAEIALEGCTIRSPINGEVLAIRVNVGQAVACTAGTPSLFLLMPDRNKLEVWASVGECDIGKIAVGQSARFTVASNPEKVYEGKVSQVRLNAQAVQNSVVFTVVVEPTEHNSQLLPFLTAEVEISTTK